VAIQPIKELIGAPITIPVSLALDGYRGGSNDSLSPSMFTSFDAWKDNWLGRNPGDEHRIGSALEGGDAPWAPPQMADGGIVTGPTMALIGEAGAEAVIPLDRLEQRDAALTQLFSSMRGELQALRRDMKLMPSQFSAAVLARA
jgi:hypothetical protein